MRRNCRIGGVLTGQPDRRVTRLGSVGIRLRRSWCAAVAAVMVVSCSPSHSSTLSPGGTSRAPIATASHVRKVPASRVASHAPLRTVFHVPKTPSGVPVLGYFRYVEYPFGDSGRPVLPEGLGWGYVAPNSIPMMGDGTDAFDHVRWSGWGHAVAYGRGSTLLFWPRGGHVSVAAELKASNPGRCHGKLAYRSIEERLILTPGTHKYRVFAKHGGLEWRVYGLPGTHGQICSGPNVL